MKKTRRQVMKKVRILEIIAPAILVVLALIISFFNLGTLYIVADIVIYIGISTYSYTLIKKCRCEHCGCRDVFEKKMGFVTTGVYDRCPKCGKKLANDKPLDRIHFVK